MHPVSQQPLWKLNEICNLNYRTKCLCNLQLILWSFDPLTGEFFSSFHLEKSDVALSELSESVESPRIRNLANTLFFGKSNASSQLFFSFGLEIVLNRCTDGDAEAAVVTTSAVCTLMNDNPNWTCLLKFWMHFTCTTSHFSSITSGIRASFAKHRTRFGFSETRLSVIVINDDDTNSV